MPSGVVTVTSMVPLPAGAVAVIDVAEWTVKLVAALAPPRYLMISIVIVSLACLLLLGGWSAKVGGADVRTGALRVAFWSALAMAVTTTVGALVGS